MDEQIILKTPSDFEQDYIYPITKSFQEFMEIGTIEKNGRKQINTPYKNGFFETFALFAPKEFEFYSNPDVITLLGILGKAYDENTQEIQEPFSVKLDHLIAKLKGKSERVGRVTDKERLETVKLLQMCNTTQMIISTEHMQQLLSEGGKEKQNRAKRLKGQYIGSVIPNSIKNFNLQQFEDGTFDLIFTKDTTVTFLELPPITKYAGDLKQTKNIPSMINDFSVTLQNGKKEKTGKRSTPQKKQILNYFIVSITPQLKNREFTAVKFETILQHLKKANITPKHITRFREDVMEVLTRLENFDEIGHYEIEKSKDGKIDFYKVVLFKKEEKKT